MNDIDTKRRPVSREDIKRQLQEWALDVDDFDLTQYEEITLDGTDQFPHLEASSAANEVQAADIIEHDSGKVIPFPTVSALKNSLPDYQDDPWTEASIEEIQAYEDDPEAYRNKPLTARYTWRLEDEGKV